MTGVLCVDKPQQMTSFACCAVLRRLLGEKKVGHTGTLDPMATGVLPLLTGKATRVLDLLPDSNKEYVAVCRFGYTSDTLDVWGQVTPTGAALPAKEAVEAALSAFRGPILQRPPMTSALKYNGKRLYELARQGIEVERPARPVTVYALELTDFDPAAGEATLRCVCSAGTYVRSLCDDIGRTLGCGGVMSALRRTAAAGFTEADCLTVEELKALAQTGELASRLRPVDQVLGVYPALTVTAPQATRFRNGGALDLDRLTRPVTGRVRVYHPDGTFLGVGHPTGETLAVLRLFV